MDAFQNGRLSEHDRILLELGRAVINANSLQRFEYQFVDGYPFAWLLHPGLRDGVIMAGYAQLRFLDHLGYIDFPFDDPSQCGDFILTPSGLAQCAELAALMTDRTPSVIQTSSDACGCCAKRVM